MVSIAKFDGLTKEQAQFWRKHPSVLLWMQPQTGLIHRIRHALATHQLHPARTVVLLPYAHLLPLATRFWKQAEVDGFTPRFETTQNWSNQTGSFIPTATDVSFDAALDTLNARDMLRRAGLDAQKDEWAEMLVTLVQQLGSIAAAIPPAQRPQWQMEAQNAVHLGMDSTIMQLEKQLASIAVVWAAQSTYASDMVFAPETLHQWDGMIAVRGLTPDPFWKGLQAVWGDRLVLLDMVDRLDGVDAAYHLSPEIAWHVCWDAEDEAQRTTACALRHIAENRLPVALISSDRALTRRVRSMLEGVNVQIRDETGWKLSTSHAGAQLMALLKAAQWNASSDAVLAWLKSAPAFAAVVNGLESALRKDQINAWRNADQGKTVRESATASEAHTQAQAILSTLQGKRPLLEWLEQLQQALRACGLWESMAADSVGLDVLAVLRLVAANHEQKVLAWDSWIDTALWKTQAMDQTSFIRWVNQSLEGANFRPTYPEREQVVILPMSQMLGRPFAAVVLAGCDEVRLPSVPEPVGSWTTKQRAALELPSREVEQQSHTAAWMLALQTPFADVLWRASDDSGETLLPSPLVQRVQRIQQVRSTTDPRSTRILESQPIQEPKPLGNALPVHSLSASSYGDLRACPYRFFALRQLGLRSADEIDTEVSQRDFGLWLHKVLERFHNAQQRHFLTDVNARRERINTISDSVTEDMHLTEGEFLPFAASWPTVREGYLVWLQEHEATGAAFVRAESAHSICIGSDTDPIVLNGRIDRTDVTAQGVPLVMDYKTESIVKTKERIKEPLEDTQMAFYAALLPDDVVEAAYIHIGENETQTHAQPAILTVREALLTGIQTDMQAIAQGQPLPALGDGVVCDYCQVRGLCRRDFWR